MAVESLIIIFFFYRLFRPPRQYTGTRPNARQGDEAHKSRGREPKNFPRPTEVRARILRVSVVYINRL